MKLNTILVPLDGSALAEAALPKAMELADFSGARILLLRAVEAHARPGADPTDAQVTVVKDSEEYLGRVRAHLRGRGITIETSVWYGPATQAILEAARHHGVDEIVMTTHGRSGLGRLLLGSVTEAVLRGTDLPVLVVHAQRSPVHTPTGVPALAEG
jgi:nucleotide-binding universal stress UspA family protein